MALSPSVSPFLPGTDPAPPSAKTTISPRYSQETINAAPQNAQNSPRLCGKQLDKVGLLHTPEKRHGFMGADCANLCDTIFNLQTNFRLLTN